jgi:hypothetical protein
MDDAAAVADDAAVATTADAILSSYRFGSVTKYTNYM